MSLEIKKFNASLFEAQGEKSFCSLKFPEKTFKKRLHRMFAPSPGSAAPPSRRLHCLGMQNLRRRRILLGALFFHMSEQALYAESHARILRQMRDDVLDIAA